MATLREMYESAYASFVEDIVEEIRRRKRAGQSGVRAADVLGGESDEPVGRRRKDSRP
jgi:hypothetical protein